MNYLLTGGLGYIGSHVCVELINSGLAKNIIILDTLINSYDTVLNNINQITNDKMKNNITFYKEDIRSNILGAIFENHNIDIVIHLAGLKSVNESIDDPLSYYDVNFCGTINLLKIMHKYDCNKLIFSSSATVYGNLNHYVNETSNTGINMTNPYGKSKYFIEEMLKDLSVSNNWSIVMLRYFNPVSSHHSGLLDENPKSSSKPNNIFPYISKVIKGEINELTIFGNDYDTIDGTCVRDFIHVIDLAKGHIASIKKLDTNGLYVYNLGTGKGTSVFQLIKTFENVNNIKINYKFGNRRNGDIPIIYADVTKAKNELNWTARYTLEDICKLHN